MKKNTFIPRTALVACSRLVDYAGAEIASLEIAEALRDLGVNVQLAALEIGAPIEEDLKLLGIKYIDLSSTEIVDREFDLLWVSHYVVAYQLLLKEALKIKVGIYSSLSHFEPLEKPPISSLFFSWYTVNSDENLGYFLNNYPDLSERVSVFPNSCPVKFINTYRENCDKVLKSIAVISNHPPAEITELISIFRSQGIKTDLIGIHGNRIRVTPELLANYSAVITIGKTVQYCLATGTPVFCYDRFGGPGWITLESFNAAKIKNFSGRCTPLRRSSRQIIENIFVNFNLALSQREELRALAKDNFNLTHNLTDILGAANNSDLSIKLSATDSKILSEDANLFVSQRQAIANYHLSVFHRDSQIVSLNQDVAERDERINVITIALIEKDIEINSQKDSSNMVLNSYSWKITKPLRIIANFIKYKKIITKINELFNLEFLLFKIFNLLPLSNSSKEKIRYFIFQKFNFLFKNFESYRLWKERINQNLSINKNLQIDKTDNIKWVIQTPQHTLFIAHLIKEQLDKFKWKTSITSNEIDHFDRSTLYIILCPQVFKILPPGENRIIYQLEQSISSRWFTDDYFEILNNSLAVIDYSLTNIKYLANNGIKYPHVYYLPVGASHTYGKNLSVDSSNNDIVFYGDSLSSPRRLYLLNKLQKYFKITIYNDLFGDDLLKALKKAKLVINIHYYDGALLEMPRIQECLSLGIKVISEESSDTCEYPELNNDVSFFPPGDINRLIELIKEFSNKEQPDKKFISVNKSNARFSFMFSRMLIGLNIIPSSQIESISPYIENSSNTFGLSLPESIDRRHTFLEIKPNECQIFDGIRRKPGWIGCGLSYKNLAMFAIKNNISNITIMEDDVVLPDNYDRKLNIINEFLELQHNKWDIFSGVIASIHPNVKILNSHFYKGYNFVTIDKMTSTVYNIYNHKAIKLLSEWDPENDDAESNTIDRYLESRTNLLVVVMLPFFVGHREEVNSTLWGFQNTQYSEMIQQSQSSLYSKLELYSKSSYNPKKIN